LGNGRFGGCNLQDTLVAHAGELCTSTCHNGQTIPPCGLTEHEDDEVMGRAYWALCMPFAFCFLFFLKQRGQEATCINGIKYTPSPCRLPFGMPNCRCQWDVGLGRGIQATSIFHSWQLESMNSSNKIKIFQHSHLSFHAR
jgi:hypothetical protein